MSTSAGTTTNTPGLFQCGFCKKHYKRVDHLARHVRSHTKSKPYQCQSCPKAFGRADLLKRHAAGHEGKSQQQQQRSPNSEQSTGRVTTACQTCASCHLRCSEEKPCRRCSTKGIECIWSDGAVADADQQTLSPAASQQQQQLPISPATASLLSESRVSESLSAESLRADGMAMAMPTATQDTVVVTETPDLGNHTSLGIDGTTHLAAATDGFQDLSFPEFNLPTGEWTPMGGFNFDLGTELDDLDLSFLGSYNASNVPFHFDDINNDKQNPAGDVTMADVSQLKDRTWIDDKQETQEEPVVIRTDAFQNSHWRFQPSSGDHGGAEEHNLSLSGSSGHGIESRIRFLGGDNGKDNGGRRRRVTTAALSSSSRDRLLSIVIANCSPENLDRAVSAFPSVEVLDALLQFYLTSPVSRASSFLHLATFDPNRKRAELLAALVAAGAVLTSDPALAKLGYAIQECVRKAVPRKWERENPTTRDLELLQAFAVNLETAIWSGHSRKVEIAESFLQPIVTMVRRSKKLGPGGGPTSASYPRPDLTAGDDGDVLTEKWTAWARHESWKRLVFRLITHDADSSMALLVNPLISYAEVLLPLPCSPQLWTATTPDAWKHVFLAPGGDSEYPTSSSSSYSPATVASTSNGNPPPRDIPSCIAHPEALIHFTGHEQHTSTDMKATLIICISVLWGMAWEHIQQASFLQRTSSCLSSSSAEQNSFLEARRTHLVSLLSRFRTVLSSYSPSSASDPSSSSSSHQPSSHSQTNTTTIPGPALSILQMRLETVSLHLHVPFSELQMLAGMEGPERAEAALGVVRAWFRGQGNDARKAAWYAGQVIMFAYGVVRGGDEEGEGGKMMMQGIVAIMVYHAGLTLWVCGLMMMRGGRRGRDKGMGGGLGQSRGRGGEIELVWLDGQDKEGLQRFLQLSDQGDARLRLDSNDGGSIENHVSLWEPGKVLDGIMGLLGGEGGGSSSSSRKTTQTRPRLVDQLILLLGELRKSRG